MNKLLIIFSVFCLSSCFLSSDKVDNETYDPAQYTKLPAKLILDVQAKKSTLTVNWKPVEQYPNHNLYLATQSFSEVDHYTNYAALENGQVINQVKPNQAIHNLSNGKYYFVLLTASSTDNKTLVSDEVNILVRDNSVSFQTKLNDTGITHSVYSNFGVCGDSKVDHRIEDCRFGRDVSHPDEADGVLGFSFTKLDQNGQALDASAKNWSCVKDNVTGLVWEVKTNADSLAKRDLHHKDWIYTFYDSRFVDADGSDGLDKGPPFSGLDGIYGGAPDKGINHLSDHCDNPNAICTTEQYVIDVNKKGLCGFKDWRLPQVNELFGIKNFNRNLVRQLDETYFPNTIWRGGYWTSTPNLQVGSYQLSASEPIVYQASANGMHFIIFHRDSKIDKASYIRLVRGGL